MSYRIRYGYDRYRQLPTKQILRAQCLGSGMLLLLVGMARLWGEDVSMLLPLLASGPVTVAERAVSALSCALAQGEGWYSGLVVWCRVIIDGAAV